MRNWREEAEAVLASVHASLPADADLVTRREACLRAKPWEFHTTSWGRKVWQKAQRAYLEQHGLPPLRRELPLSPLERQAQKFREAQERAAVFEAEMATFEREPRR